MGGTRQPSAAQELGGRRDGARLGMQGEHWQPMLPPRLLLKTCSSGPHGGIVFVLTQPVSKHLPSSNLPTDALKLFPVPAASCSAGLWPCRDGGCAPICTSCLFPGWGLRSTRTPKGQVFSRVKCPSWVTVEAVCHPILLGAAPGASPELRLRLPGERLDVRGGSVTERAGWAWKRQIFEWE